PRPPPSRLSRSPPVRITPSIRRPRPARRSRSSTGAPTPVASITSVHRLAIAPFGARVATSGYGVPSGTRSRNRIRYRHFQGGSQFHLVTALFLDIEDYDPEKLSDFPVWKNLCH